jgi:hypothetical protein
MQHTDCYLEHLPELLDRWAMDVARLDVRPRAASPIRRKIRAAGGLQEERELNLDQWANDVERLMRKREAE